MSTPTTNPYALGSLLTTFTPPPSCSSIYYTYTNSPYEGVFQAATCFSGSTTLYEDYSCYPTTTSGAPFPSVFLYSPGLDCPAGFTTACLATAGAQNSCQPWPPLQSGETGVVCCSTMFNMPTVTDGPGECYQNFTPPGVRNTVSLTQASCANDSLVYQTIVLPMTLTSTNGSLTGLFTETTWIISAPPIQLRWQATDLSGFSSDSSHTASTSLGQSMSTPTAQSSAIALPTVSTTPGPSTSANAMTTAASTSTRTSGAQVEIGAGIGAVGVLVLLGALAL